MDLHTLRIHPEEEQPSSSSATEPPTTAASAVPPSSTSSSSNPADQQQQQGSKKKKNNSGVFGVATASSELKGLYKIKGLHRDLSCASDVAVGEDVPAFGVDIPEDKVEELTEVRKFVRI